VRNTTMTAAVIVLQLKGVVFFLEYPKTIGNGNSKSWVTAQGGKNRYPGLCEGLESCRAGMYLFPETWVRPRERTRGYNIPMGRGVNLNMVPVPQSISPLGR